MTTIKVQAAEGRRVRDPATGRVMPPEGVEIDDTDIYWRKRLTQGDVMPVGASPAATPAPAAPRSAPATPAAAPVPVKPAVTGPANPSAE